MKHRHVTNGWVRSRSAALAASAAMLAATPFCLAANTYYVAPAPVRVEGVLIGGGDRGGFFIANDGRHAAWFGDARDDADDRAGTLLGAIGAGAPKLWVFSPALPLKPVAR